MKPEIILPWPDRERHPNSRTHWGRKSRLTKKTRTAAGWYATDAGWHREKWPDGRLHVWIDFYPPDRRKRDTDGMLSNIKAELDGIADVMRIDDSRFVPHPWIKDEVRKDGEVRIRITSAPMS